MTAPGFGGVKLSVFMTISLKLLVLQQFFDDTGSAMELGKKAFIHANLSLQIARRGVVIWSNMGGRGSGGALFNHMSSSKINFNNSTHLRSRLGYSEIAF